MPAEKEVDTNEDISIEQALGAAYDAVEAGDKAPVAEEIEIDTPASDVVPDEVVATDDSSTPGALEKEDVEKEEPEEEEAEGGPEDYAPSSWKREVSEKWKDLPPEIRAEVHRRESDFHKAIEPYKQNAAIGQEIQKVVAPYMANIQASGVEPMAAIASLLTMEHNLRNGSPQQKSQAVSQILQEYGVDLASVQPPAPIDPAVQELRKQNQQLQRFQQSYLDQQNQAVMSDIEKFKSDPKNVHFEVVKEDMAALLQSSRAESLQDAYDKAVWMRPDIRKSLVEQQRTEAEKKAAQTARAQRAKSASGSVKGSAPSKVSSLAKDASLTDIVGAAMDGLI